MRTVVTGSQDGIEHSPSTSAGFIFFLSALPCFCRRRIQQRQIAPKTKTAPLAPKRDTAIFHSWMKAP